MTSEDTDLAARLVPLVSEYDKKWSAVDIAGVAGLWEREDPQPIYIGDEYAMPLVGAEELDRHWARIGSRLKCASVSSQLWSADALAGGIARCHPAESMELHQTRGQHRSHRRQLDHLAADASRQQVPHLLPHGIAGLP